MPALLLIVLFIFFFLSWVYGGFEIGIISLDRFKLEQEAKKSKIKKTILYFYNNTDKTFGTTMIGNNIANVVIASLGTYLFHKVFSDNPNIEYIATISIAFFVLIFCEILPKNLFRDYPNKFVEIFFPLIFTSYVIMKPLVKVVSFIDKILKKLFNINPATQSTFTKDDFAQILDQSYGDDETDNLEKEMLSEALEFNELFAKNVMKPRTDIIAIPQDMKYEEILTFVRKEEYTRYPVYNETLDEITGILIIFDLINVTDKKKTAKDFQREMFFVPESMDVNKLLKEMQIHQKTMAIVVDSYGGTSGLLTIEDILEEIVGEIEDEFDNEETKDVYKVDDNTWIVNSFVEVDDLNDDHDLNLPTGDYETISGLVINHLASIPIKGQKIDIGEYKLEIIDVSDKKIKKVKIVRVIYD